MYKRQVSALLGRTPSTVEPAVAGPRRPQDHIRLASIKDSFRKRCV